MDKELDKEDWKLIKWWLRFLLLPLLVLLIILLMKMGK